MGREFYPFLLPLLALFLSLEAAGVTVVGDVPAGLPCLRWPTAALGGVLIVAAIGLFDVVSLRRLWRVSRAEFSFAVVTMVGVIALDLSQGILLAVAVALLLLLRRSARPTDAVVGRVPGMKVSTTSPTLRTPRRPRGCCCTGSTPRSSSSTQPTSAIASWSWLLPNLT